MAAFDRFVEQLTAHELEQLVRRVRGQMPASVDADDAVAEAIARLYGRGHAWASPDVLLVITARNILRDRWKSHGTRRTVPWSPVVHDGVFASDDWAQVDARIDRPVVIATVRAALAALPAHWRDVLVRRYWHQQPYPVIASALGVSDGVARMMASRAVARLRGVIWPMREALHAA